MYTADQTPVRNSPRRYRSLHQKYAHSFDSLQLSYYSKHQIISWNKAYALFALPTFIHHKTYLLSRLSACSSANVASYSHRGWKPQDVLWYEEEISGRTINRGRRMGDRFTCTMALPTRGFSCRPRTPDFVLEYSHFRLHEEEDKATSLRYYKVQAHSLKAPVLKHQFTHDDRERIPVRFRDSFWATTSASGSAN